MKKTFLIITTALCGVLLPLSAAVEMLVTSSCLTAKSYTDNEVFIATQDGEPGSYLFSINSKNTIKAYSLAEKIYDINGKEYPNPVYDSPIKHIATYEHGLLFSTYKEPHICYVVTPFKGQLILDRFIDVSTVSSEPVSIVSIDTAGPEVLVGVDTQNNERHFIFYLLNKAINRYEEIIDVKNDAGDIEQVTKIVEKNFITEKRVTERVSLLGNKLKKPFATFLPMAVAQKGSEGGARKSLEPLIIAHKAPLQAPTSSIFTLYHKTVDPTISWDSFDNSEYQEITACSVSLSSTHVLNIVTSLFDGKISSVLAHPLCNTGNHFLERAAIKAPVRTYNEFLPFGNYAATEVATPVRSAEERVDTLVGNRQLQGKVKKTITANDAVYVLLVSETQEVFQAWRSQMIFNADGHVVGWSDWAPMVAFNTEIVDIFFAGNSFYYLLRDQDDVITFHTALIFRQDHDTALQEAFSNIAGGVQTAFEIPLSAALYGSQPRYTYTLYGGYKFVHALPSAVYDNGRYRYLSTEEFADNSYTHEVSGIERLGSVTTYALVELEDQTYLVAGGMNGIAVCVNKDGSGLAHGALSDDLSALADCTWKFIAYDEQEPVIKLYAYGTNLYSITKRGAYMCDCSSFNITSLDTPAAVLNDIFVDVTGIYLATSSGLLYKKHNAATWETIKLPEAAFCCVQVQSIQQKGITQSTGVNMLYVTCVDPVNEYTTIHRVAVESVEGVVRISPVFETRFANQPDVYMRIEDYHNFWATDGTVGIGTRSSNPAKKMYGYIASFVPIIPKPKLIRNNKAQQLPSLDTRIRMPYRSGLTGDWRFISTHGTLSCR